jgi:hypothetical protein
MLAHFCTVSLWPVADRSKVPGADVAGVFAPSQAPTTVAHDEASRSTRLRMNWQLYLGTSPELCDEMAEVWLMFVSMAVVEPMHASIQTEQD